MRRILVSVLALLALSGCSTGGQSADETPNEPKVTLTIQVANEGLTLAGTADVPDGTPVNLHVGRNIKFARDDMARSMPIAQDQVEVTGKKFEAALAADESDLVFDASGKRYGKIQVVSDSVTACAQIRLGDSAKPLEAIATTLYPSPVLPDLKAALGKPVRHEEKVGQPYCAID